MIYVLTVPGPIEDVEQVRILEWHGAEGRHFAQGELIVELETHKALVEIRAGRAAILRRVLCQAADWCRIGGAIALFSDTTNEPLPDDLDGAGEMPVAFEVL
jgi:pyruvate/2-oxoglutarate dehydrogenase complex dihydrolipoamide acyltransferase (E2) component